MEAIGYIRVSKQENDVEGLSPDVQREAIRNYAQMKRLKLVGIVEDLGVSGGKPIESRKGGRGLVESLRSEPRVLIASRQDRLFRSIKDAVNSIDEFRDIGVDVILIAEGLDLSTPAGRLLFHVMAAMGEYEREIIGVRTQEAMDLKRSRREQISRYCPYGFTFRPTNRFNKEGKIIQEMAPNPAEQQVIKQMLQRNASGYSNRRIAEWLDNQGVKTRGGKKWGESSVRKILAEAKQRERAAAADASDVTDRNTGPAAPGDTQGGTAP